MLSSISFTLVTQCTPNFYKTRNNNPQKTLQLKTLERTHYYSFSTYMYITDVEQIYAVIQILNCKYQPRQGDYNTQRHYSVYSAPTVQCPAPSELLAVCNLPAVDLHAL